MTPLTVIASWGLVGLIAMVSILISMLINKPQKTDRKFYLGKATQSQKRNWTMMSKEIMEKIFENVKYGSISMAKKDSVMLQYDSADEMFHDMNTLLLAGNIAIIDFKEMSMTVCWTLEHTVFSKKNSRWDTSLLFFLVNF